MIEISACDLPDSRRVAELFRDSPNFDYAQMANQPTPPWGSKGRVNKAGANIRVGKITPDDQFALEMWRGAHSYVLNTFKPLLWSRVRGKNIIVAQRLKRRTTIIDKLFREPSMELVRMDDIAGARLIFESVRALEAFREVFHCSRFKHKFRHADKDKYNYILVPKSSGYRGVHEIYTYNVNSVEGRKYNGLYIEIQFRTLCQHAWATAVEVVSRITENQPKFDKGDDRHREFFRLASEIIARTHEGLTSCRADLSDAELCARFKALDAEINIMRFLRNIPVFEQASRFKNNVVLQLTPVSKDDGMDVRLTVHNYIDIRSATEAYFRLEKANPEDDIVLVRAKTFDDIRSAYRNYFQNTNEFILFVENGMKKLQNSDGE